MGEQLIVKDSFETTPTEGWRGTFEVNWYCRGGLGNGFVPRKDSNWQAPTEEVTLAAGDKFSFPPELQELHDHQCLSAVHEIVVDAALI